MKLNNYPKVIFKTSTKEDENMSFLHGEIDDVIKNRKSFLQTCGLSLEDCVVMSVEHSDTIMIVTKKDRGRGTLSRENLLTAEALVTDEKNVILFLLTADCFPVAFFDPAQDVIALAHLGWKPTHIKLAQKIINVLVMKYKSDPKDIIVSFGPGIQKESYVLKEIAQMNSPEWKPYIQKQEDGSVSIDLVGYNNEQLLASGIIKENIETTKIDTATSEKYFSHYREVRTGEKTGRFATILTMK